MRVVAAEAIDRALTFPALTDALAEAFRGDVVAPERHHHHIERAGRTPGTLLIMPAWSAGGFMGVKVATIFPDNALHGLPSLLGAYLLMDGATGQPLALLDGARLTLWRTAAASALAARYLARPDARRMAMVGAGALAPFLIRAHLSQRPIEAVTLWNHRPDRAETLASALRAEGLPVTATADLEDAVRADLVSCATHSPTPLIRGAWLKPGSHLDLVGAFHPGAREADDEVLRRASIYVDTPAALSEGGDVAVGLESGAIGAADVRGDLFGLCRSEIQGRAQPNEITVFKSVGAALEDLSAAVLVWRALAPT